MGFTFVMKIIRTKYKLLIFNNNRTMVIAWIKYYLK
jgi:hypothetical protein